MPSRSRAKIQQNFMRDHIAGMAKLVDALVLGTSGATHGSSSLPPGTRAWSPSSKARVCKTLIRGCDSHPGLQDLFFSKQFVDLLPIFFSEVYCEIDKGNCLYRHILFQKFAQLPAFSFHEPESGVFLGIGKDSEKYGRAF